MAKDGSVLGAASFTRSGGTGAGIADQVADDKVLAQLANGATLVLQGLHRTWPPLVDFGSRLAAELGHPIQINAYITPPENQGFAAHYDTHDVFVLQVAGTKQWRIHRPVLEHPLPEQTWDLRRQQVAARAAEPPLIDAVLRPGDALYLPRGFLHSAVAQGEVSIHLTVGVHPITGHELARRLAQLLATDADLRRSLPLGPVATETATLAGHVAKAAVRLGRAVAAAGDAQFATIADQVSRQLARDTRPVALQPLAQLGAVATLTGDTEVRLRPGLRPRVRRTGDATVLDVIDTSIRLPTGDRRRHRRAADRRRRGARRPARPRPGRAARAGPAIAARGSRGAGRSGRRCLTTRPRRRPFRRRNGVRSRRAGAEIRCSARPFPPPGCCWSSSPGRGAGLGCRRPASTSARRTSSSPAMNRRGVRVLAIRRPGRTVSEAQRRWCFVDCGRGRESAAWGRFDTDAELIRLDVDALGAVGPRSAEQADVEPFFAVCVHGTHDVLLRDRGPARGRRTRTPASRPRVGVQPCGRRPVRGERAGAAVGGDLRPGRLRRRCRPRGCGRPGRRPARLPARPGGTACRRRRRPSRRCWRSDRTRRWLVSAPPGCGL